jgi:hypothetical protein
MMLGGVIFGAVLLIALWLWRSFGWVYGAVMGVALLLSYGGCLGKPTALQQSERLALRVQSDGGATNVLRAWFTEIQLRPVSEEVEPALLQIPTSLSSEMWQGAKAWAERSEHGRFENITVTKNYDSYITIGPPTASAADLGLAGQPPCFPVQIADGMYAWVRYK